MHNLVPLLCLAFAAGIAIADRGWIGAFHAHRIAGLALAFASLPVCGSGWRRCGVAFAFAALGAAALAERLEAARDPRIYQPVECNVEAWVCALDSTGEFVRIELCDVRSVAAPPIQLPSRIQLSSGFDPMAGKALARLRRGDALRARVRILPPREIRNPGDRHDPRRLARRGIGARAHLAAPELVVRLSTHDRAWAKVAGVGEAWLGGLRARVGARLSALGPGGELLRALAVGDRSGLSREQRAAFAALGISHLLAVSGLHIALVAGIGYTGLRRSLVWVPELAASRDVRRLAVLGALVLAFVYALLSGWRVPVQRAFLFLGVCGIALGLGRRVSAAQLLAIAGLAVLLVGPDALFDIGAQLSFAATAALLFVFRSRAADDEESRGAIASLARTSTIAIAATAPLIAWHGGIASPLAPAANLFAVPWTGLVVLPSALLGMMLSFLPGFPGVASVLALLAEVAEFSLAAVQNAAELLPDSWKSASRPAGLAILGALVLSGMALRAKSPLRGIAWVLLSTLLVTLAPARAISPGPPRIASFDVGLGDATLVEGRAAALLVDAGRAFEEKVDLGRSVVVPALEAMSVERLDLVVATHADLDHRGGLPSVLDALSVGVLWLPPGGKRDPAFSALLEVALRREVRVREVAAGERQAFGDLEVEVLWPPLAASRRSRNEASLVLRVEFRAQKGESVRVLLTGDVGASTERSLLDRASPLGAEILKIGHHGSRHSSTRPFLEAVRPRIALISAPCASRRALPTQEVIERIRAVGSRIQWTGRDGASVIGIRSGRGDLTMRQWVSGTRCEAARQKKIRLVEPLISQPKIVLAPLGQRTTLRPFLAKLEKAQ